MELLKIAVAGSNMPMRARFSLGLPESDSGDEEISGRRSVGGS